MFRTLQQLTILSCLIASGVFGIFNRNAAADVLPEKIAPLLSVVCKAPFEDPQRFRSVLKEVKILEHNVSNLAGAPGRAKTVLFFKDGLRADVQTLFPAGRLRRVTIEVHDDLPRSSISTDSNCQITEARDIVYTSDNRPELIRVYRSDLKTIASEIALNPDVPPGNDPGGVTVGLIDSGVNYTLDTFNKNLARDPSGKLIGRDFWDGDEQPYDADLGRSDFFPFHHGSAVMSVLIREAPMSRVIAVRYPRPDMTQMGAAIDWLASEGVRIVNVAMGSGNRAQWQAFSEAASRHPRMLFVLSAGNDGQNIDKEPVYPASLLLPNSIVVTSSLPDGRLAHGSNWGPESVDVMVPGERLSVIDHRGAAGKASGSSFAAPRVTALAVRALAKNPSWHGPELRDWILKRARQTSGPDATRYGWIPDPSDGP